MRNIQITAFFFKLLFQNNFMSIQSTTLISTELGISVLVYIQWKYNPTFFGTATKLFD